MDNLMRDYEFQNVSDKIKNIRNSVLDKYIIENMTQEQKEEYNSLLSEKIRLLEVENNNYKAELYSDSCYNNIIKQKRE